MALFDIIILGVPGIGPYVEGDIIDVKPSPFLWSRSIVGPKDSPFLALTLNISPEEAKKLKNAYYEDGLEPENIILPNRVKIKERKYNIPIGEVLAPGWLPTLNISRVRDRNDAYQPFDKQVVIDCINEKCAVIYDKFKQGFKYQARKAT